MCLNSLMSIPSPLSRDLKTGSYFFSTFLKFLTNMLTKSGNSTSPSPSGSADASISANSLSVGVNPKTRIRLRLSCPVIRPSLSSFRNTWKASFQLPRVSSDKFSIFLESRDDGLT
eukprot:Lithocolla_globosa_v1_NODE_3148_length_1750_cov_81.515044.p3 type:complete len:116 gc:universal NODE_3148_length_1750_cov_81.515044:1231-884(-)